MNGHQTQMNGHQNKKQNGRIANRLKHSPPNTILHSFQFSVELGIKCERFFVYFTIPAPSEGLFWNNFITLPSSPTMLVYFTIQAPSAGLFPELAISFLPPLQVILMNGHWNQKQIGWTNHLQTLFNIHCYIMSTWKNVHQNAITYKNFFTLIPKLCQIEKGFTKILSPPNTISHCPKNFRPRV